MKNKLNRITLFLLISFALSVTMLVGCARRSSVEEAAAPVVTAAPTSPAEPVASPETETAAGHQAGERYEGTVTLDGMEQTVRYEQLRSDTIGFEMGYDYERFERYSEPDRERFILKGEDPEHPEVYLEVTRRAEDAETTAASIVEALSDEYDPYRGEFTLDHAGSCIKINADADKNGQMTIDRLQVVYIIPAADGCIVAWGHNGFDSADAFGALYRSMMHTLVVLEEHGAPAMSVPSARPSDQNQESASGRFTGAAGSEFIVPEGFIQLDEKPSIGYQYTFWHPDYEIRIVVYEIAPGSIPEGAYETDYSIAARNPDVVYFDHGENWFVQSGYNNNGEEIFYSKESMTDSGLKTFWISYPTAGREYGDPITAEFEANFRF